MKSITLTSHTTTMQLAVIAMAVGMLSLSAIQFSVTSLLSQPNHNRTSNAARITLIKNTINLENEIVKSFGEMTRYFSAVSNARTANLVIPNIKHFNAQLDNWIAQTGHLAASEQTSITMITKENLGSLELVIKEAMRRPGVSSVLEPTVAPLMRQLLMFVQRQFDVAV